MLESFLVFNIFKKISMKKKYHSISKLVSPGISLIGEGAGGAIASVLGWYFGGPAGGAVVAIGKKLTVDQFAKIGEDINNKTLSKRENARIGAVSLFAMNQIERNLENNLEVRTDGFFKRNPISDRSDADEIFEGTLIAAKNEHEEKKLRFYGNLVANIAFHSEIDRYQANYLLRISEGLSYRQICLLAIFGKKANYNLYGGRSEDLFKDLNQNEKIVYREVGELKLLNLLWSKNEFLMGGGVVGNIVPANLEQTETGSVLNELMNLNEIEGADLKEIISILSKPSN